MSEHERLRQIATTVQRMDVLATTGGGVGFQDGAMPLYVTYSELAELAGAYLAARADAARLPLRSVLVANGAIVGLSAILDGSVDYIGRKLTEEDVRCIRGQLIDGVTQSAIAKDYGVSQSTISNIANHKTWRVD